MERKTSWVADGAYAVLDCNNCEYRGNCPHRGGLIYEEVPCYRQACIELAKLEDKLESGQLQEVNNKPLTVEELKALKVGDWVWVIHTKDNYSCYEKIAGIEKTRILFYGADLSTTFATYGKKWIAYKNKEEAE